VKRIAEIPGRGSATPIICGQSDDPKAEALSKNVINDTFDASLSRLASSCSCEAGQSCTQFKNNNAGSPLLSVRFNITGRYLEFQI